MPRSPGNTKRRRSQTPKNKIQKISSRKKSQQSQSPKKKSQQITSVRKASVSSPTKKTKVPLKEAGTLQKSPKAVKVSSVSSTRPKSPKAKFQARGGNTPTTTQIQKKFFRPRSTTPVGKKKNEKTSKESADQAGNSTGGPDVSFNNSTGGESTLRYRPRPQMSSSSSSGEFAKIEPHEYDEYTHLRDAVHTKTKSGLPKSPSTTGANPNSNNRNSRQISRTAAGQMRKNEYTGKNIELNEVSSTKKANLERMESGESDAFATKKPANLQGDYGNVILLLILYTLQGIPMGFSGTLPLILKDRGASYSDLGLISMTSLPFGMKLLWAPIVDTIYHAGVGRRKTWLLPVIFHIFDIRPGRVNNY